MLVHATMVRWTTLRSHLGLTTSKITINVSRARQDPRAQLGASYVLNTRPPLTTTQAVSSREHHSCRRTTVFTSSLPCLALASIPPPTRNRPSTLMMTSTRDSRLRDWWLAATDEVCAPTPTYSRCCPNADIFTMLVDRGASNHLVNDERIPRLWLSRVLQALIWLYYGWICSR